MKRIGIRPAGILLFILWFIVAAPALAADDKPFADHHLVLQISDPGPERQDRVLNVASNLVKYYGPDQIDMEIVVFGPAISMLFADSLNQARIASLAHSGIRFSACDNTLDTITRKTGKEPALLPQSYRVTAGVARILELVRKGYTLVKP